MKVIPILFVTMTFFLSGCFAQPPDTRDLDAAIQSLQDLKDKATAKANQYSGGAINTIIDLELAYLNTSIAMLQMKKNSLVNFIELDINVDANSDSSAKPVALEELTSDIEKVERSRAAAQSQADTYSGGLLRTVKLMEVATHDATLASLNMKMLAAKWQIPGLKPGESQSTDAKDESRFDDEAL